MPTPALPASKNATIVRKRLRGHRLFIDQNVFEKNSEQYKSIMATLASDVGKGLGEESAKALEIALKKYDEDNEATFLDSVLPLLAPRSDLNPMRGYIGMKIEATIKAVQVPLGYDPGNVACDLKEYEDDGIKGATNAHFEEGFLPHLYADPAVIAEMKKLDGMTTPVPDRILGYDNSLFQLPES